MSDIIKNTLSLLSQGLIGRLREGCLDDWHGFTRHRFVKELAQGSLPQEEFKQFLIQDYLYLLEYCRVEALAVYKSHSFKDMQHFSALMKGIIEVELPFHISYCKEWGITQEQLESSPRSLELIAYSHYLLNKSMQGDILDLMVLIMPCLVGYGEIGLTLLIDSKTNKMNNPYMSWINLYSGSDYLTLIKDNIQYLESLGHQYGAEQRYPILAAEFRAAVQLETAFWNCGQFRLL